MRNLKIDVVKSAIRREKQNAGSALRLDSTVQDLSIVCYAEQLIKFDGENEAETWDREKERIRIIRKDKYVVFCIAHCEIGGKLHYHFVVFVTKKKDGTPNKQRVSAILKELGIVFRDGVDEGLFANNVRRVEHKNAYEQILYLLHHSKSGQGKKQYNIWDLCSNFTDEELEIYCENGGNTQKLQMMECDNTLLQKMRDNFKYALKLIKCEDKYNTIDTVFRGYKQLTDESKQALMGEIFSDDNNYAITMFNYSYLGLVDVTMGELLACQYFNRQEFVDELMEGSVLINEDNQSALLLLTDTDFIPLTNDTFFDFSMQLEQENDEEDIEKDAMYQIEKYVVNGFSCALKTGMIEADTPILAYEDDYTKVDVAYLSDDSTRNLFKLAFDNEFDNELVGNIGTVKDVKEKYITDLDEFISHYKLIGGQVIYPNKTDLVFLFEKDNDTYVDITKDAQHFYKTWLYRYGDDNQLDYEEDDTDFITEEDEDEEANTDKHLFVQVKFDNSNRLYTYLCNDNNVVDGDKAEVIANGDKQIVTVINHDWYIRGSEPYDPSHCKSIIRIISPESNLDVSEPIVTGNEMSLNNGFDEKPYTVNNEPVFDDDECPFY